MAFKMSQEFPTVSLDISGPGEKKEEKKEEETYGYGFILGSTGKRELFSCYTGWLFADSVAGWVSPIEL